MRPPTFTIVVSWASYIVLLIAGALGCHGPLATSSRDEGSGQHDATTDEDQDQAISESTNLQIGDAAYYPTDIAGAYLTCPQTDYDLNYLPNQRDALAGDGPTVAFACYLVDKGQNRATVDMSTVTLTAHDFFGVEQPLAAIYGPGDLPQEKLFKLSAEALRIIRNFVATRQVDGQERRLQSPSPLAVYRFTDDRGTTFRVGQINSRLPRGSVAGGDLVLLEGHGFSHGANSAGNKGKIGEALKITIGDTPCELIPGDDDYLAFADLTVLPCITGPHAPGTVDVKVARLDGGDLVLRSIFQYVTDPPPVCGGNVDGGRVFQVCNVRDLATALASPSKTLVTFERSFIVSSGAAAVSGFDCTGVEAPLIIDGQGHYIMSLTIGGAADATRRGLCQRLQNATIRNLALIDSHLDAAPGTPPTGTVGPALEVGLLVGAGQSPCRLENVTVEGQLNVTRSSSGVASAAHVGGFAGRLDGCEVVAARSLYSLEINSDLPGFVGGFAGTMTDIGMRKGEILSRVRLSSSRSEESPIVGGVAGNITVARASATDAADLSATDPPPQGTMDSVLAAVELSADPAATNLSDAGPRGAVNGGFFGEIDLNSGLGFRISKSRAVVKYQVPVRSVGGCVGHVGGVSPATLALTHTVCAVRESPENGAARPSTQSLGGVVGEAIEALTLELENVRVAGAVELSNDTIFGGVALVPADAAWFGKLKIVSLAFSPTITNLSRMTALVGGAFQPSLFEVYNALFQPLLKAPQANAVVRLTDSDVLPTVSGTFFWDLPSPCSVPAGLTCPVVRVPSLKGNGAPEGFIIEDDSLTVEVVQPDPL